MSFFQLYTLWTRETYFFTLFTHNNIKVKCKKIASTNIGLKSRPVKQLLGWIFTGYSAYLSVSNNLLAPDPVANPQELLRIRIWFFYLNHAPAVFSSHLILLYNFRLPHIPVHPQIIDKNMTADTLTQQNGLFVPDGDLISKNPNSISVTTNKETERRRRRRKQKKNKKASQQATLTDSNNDADNETEDEDSQSQVQLDS